MIQENNEYLFTIDNDHISSLVLFDLTIRLSILIRK